MDGAQEARTSSRGWTEDCLEGRFATSGRGGGGFLRYTGRGGGGTHAAYEARGECWMDYAIHSKPRLAAITMIHFVPFSRDEP